MSATIRITGPGEFGDYLSGHRWASRRHRLTVRIVAVVVGVLCLGGTASAVGIGIFLLLWAAFLNDMLFRYRVRRMWQRDGGTNDDDIRLTFSDDGVESFGDDGQSVFEPWSHFVDWTESPEVFLLRTSSRSWVIVPRRLAGPEDGGRLRHLFQQHIRPGRAAQARPVPRAATTDTGGDQ